MSSSDLSSLSSAESIETDDEILSSPVRGNTGNLDRWLKDAKASATPPSKRKRSPSPPHEYVLADNPDIAFIVMFRARFSDAFPRSVPQLGPQDVERGVVDTLPDEHVEKLLCGLIGLVLNRKKDVEKGHYTRALEEAIQTNAHQWPRAWEGKNPLHGGGSFNNMTPSQRLVLMRALVLWALNSSDAIQTVIKESYKQQRQEDDLNQALSVQPWGRDSDRRRYWLIEGREDTHFRLYREGNGLRTRTWWSVADSIPTIKEAAEKLNKEGQAGRRLHDRIHSAIARFETGEDKRKRRDYRLARKAQFSRPEPGFSLYEGRTRGKRVRYTFSDEEGEGSDALSTRRSTRQSGVSTPAEGLGPTFTASGRQVKSRLGGLYGETMHSGQQSRQGGTDISDGDRGDGVDGEPSENFRSLRGGRGQPQSNERASRSRAGYQADSDDSDAVSTGDEWNGGDEDADDDDAVEDDEADADEDSNMSDITKDNEDDTGKSLIVSLRIPLSRQDEIKKDEPFTRNGSEPPEEVVVVLPTKAISTTLQGVTNGDLTVNTESMDTDMHTQNDISITSEAPSYISQTQAPSSVTSFTPTDSQPSKTDVFATTAESTTGGRTDLSLSAVDRNEPMPDASTEETKLDASVSSALPTSWDNQIQQKLASQHAQQSLNAAATEGTRPHVNGF